MYDVVFAPWRYRYVSSIRKHDCFLCRVAMERNDDENLVPYRGRKVYVILNKYPYTWGHAMIAPYRHISQIGEMDDEEWVEMWKVAMRLIEALKKVASASDFIVGINVGRAAGAGLESHLHLHIIPRDTRVQGEDLDARLVALTRALREVI